MRWKHLSIPAAVFVVTSGVYLLTLGPRVLEPSRDNHFMHLAASLLEGQLAVLGDRPPGTNDWACYDTVERGPCPPNRFAFPGEGDRYQWFVSFPPFPALVALPAVAVLGPNMPDRAFWGLLAGLGPALLFVLLGALRESGRSTRTVREDLALTALFAFGTVYYFVAVQGTVWFAAHVVATPLLCLYMLFSLDARRPVLAGLMLGLAFMTRATTAFLVVFFVIEALEAARATSAVREGGDEAVWWQRTITWARGVDVRVAARSLSLFAVPILMIGFIAMWMNHARFEDPFEFGHTYLQIYWRDRIERWGLFNYHYFAKNLSVYVAGLPWLSAHPPYITVSRHGLALWFTTPALLWIFFPRARVSPTMVGLFAAAGVVAVLNLCYQNSGWEQFGYRFALDYMVLCFALLAIGGRRLGVGFYALLVFAIAVNTFGALTYHRAFEFYDTDATQNVIFQPD